MMMEADKTERHKTKADYSWKRDGMMAKGGFRSVNILLPRTLAL